MRVAPPDDLAPDSGPSEQAPAAAIAVSEGRAVNFSPREIVSELDRYIVGQNDAKRAVAIALRNRWRRQQLSPELREEVLPKNILMIGPTGVGKTEIARRLARLAQAPFLKVEATKFTEVGYVGRDVEQIVRDLVEISLAMVRERMRREVTARAEVNAEERVLDALVGDKAGAETRAKFRRMLRSGELDAKEIELQVKEGGGGFPTFDIPGVPGASMGMVNLSEMLGQAMGGRTKTRRMSVADSHKLLITEESDKLLDTEKLTATAIEAEEQNGIVFLDEIDKICGRSEQRGGADVSREGVQRDLLPLIEGTQVATKHGTVKTDHVLFIASGAFHLAKPSDLLPELQGRLPIRVELAALGREDLKRILVEPETSLIRQYIALLGTEQVTLDFTEDAIDALADLAAEINGSIENIGARRLHTVMERLLEEISFNASDRGGTAVTIDAAYVRDKVAPLAKNTDLSKFIL
jgi:ATP-dependent HslUV protease ATP-binding subunit HslU